MTSSIVTEKVVRLSGLVRRITQDNPGLMTGSGTNTYLVGRECVFVIDPGENTDHHFRNILDCAGATPVVGVAPTHAHPDHWPLAPRLAAALGTSTYGFKSHNGYSPTVLLEDGALLDRGEWTFDVIHTPGHASDHLSFFLRQERALFSGDHVMGWSTSVISRPDGNLKSYLSSLQRLLSMEIVRIYPAHGEPVEDARVRIRELIEHRHMRTEQLREALRAGIDTLPKLVERIYADVDPNLHPMARQSLLAHVEALMEEGEVVAKPEGRDGSEFRYALKS